MTAIITSETSQTVLGGIIVLFVLALVIKVGPLRFLGEMLAHLAFKIIFVLLAFGVLYLFANTQMGEALGGLSTGLVLVFAAPFVFLIIGLVQWVLKRNSTAGEQGVDDDR